MSATRCRVWNVVTIVDVKNYIIQKTKIDIFNLLLFHWSCSFHPYSVCPKTVMSKKGETGRHLAYLRIATMPALRQSRSHITAHLLMNFILHTFHAVLHNIHYAPEADVGSTGAPIVKPPNRCWMDNVHYFELVSAPGSMRCNSSFKSRYVHELSFDWYMLTHLFVEFLWINKKFESFN